MHSAIMQTRHTHTLESIAVLALVENKSAVSIWTSNLSMQSTHAVHSLAGPDSTRRTAPQTNHKALHQHKSSITHHHPPFPVPPKSLPYMASINTSLSPREASKNNLAVPGLTAILYYRSKHQQDG